MMKFFNNGGGGTRLFEKRNIHIFGTDYVQWLSCFIPKLIFIF